MHKEIRVEAWMGIDSSRYVLPHGIRFPSTKTRYLTLLRQAYAGRKRKMTVTVDSFLNCRRRLGKGERRG